ncbi:hypothetical protein KFK09_019212 [Dendrobium nobile]|uniref:Uncharacterized protein n=1 Tax=Dendrobium nobile TaxID=94219 RepID=A0A8T3AY85_DENNO|nr:hypothetical protein KFK09_019212 [Dendrobium nobile]
MDAAGTNLDVVSKIEKFVLQPKIENCIIRCHRATEKSLPWLTLFESAGFKPVQFSNFTGDAGRMPVKEGADQWIQCGEAPGLLFICFGKKGN